MLSGGFHTRLYPASFLTKDTAAAKFAQALLPKVLVKGWEVPPETQVYLWGCLSQTTSVICK